MPESAWRVESQVLKAYLATQVRAALVACVDRLLEGGLAVSEIDFFQQVDAAIAEWVSPSGTPNNSSKPMPLRGTA